MTSEEKLTRALTIIEALAAVCDRIRVAHGDGCRCLDCREIRAALKGLDEIEFGAGAEVR